MNIKMDRLGIIIWFFGKYLAFGSVIFCLGACAAWYFEEKDDEVDNDENEVSSSSCAKVFSVYFHLIMFYSLTMCSMTVVLQHPLLLRMMVHYPTQLTMGSAVLLHFLVGTLEKSAALQECPIVRVAVWMTYSLIPGPLLALFGPDICSKTALWTFLSSLVANAAAWAAPKDLSETLRYPLKVLYFVSCATLLLCSVISLKSLVGLINLAVSLYGGMLLFFGVFITHAQLVFQDLDRHAFDPVFTASVMYLATFNMFLRIALFFVVDSTSVLS